MIQKCLSSVGNIINLLSKAITDTTNGTYISNNQTALYNSYTGDCYEIDLIIRKTNIRTGSRLVLM